MEKFWDFKSKNYPTPMDEYGLVTPNRVLSKVKEFGIDFRSKNILDIGCGTGLYSSLMCKEANSILGVDLSNGMLNHFKNFIEMNDIKNIELKKMDFKEFNEQNQYDIVLSAMTPAISSFADIDSMINLSKDICIYISFSKQRHSPLMDNILETLGYASKMSNKFFDTKEYINSLGYEIQDEYFEHNWSNEGTLDEMTNDVLQHLKLREINEDKEKIQELLKPHIKENGKILRETFSNIGVLVWRV